MSAILYVEGGGDSKSLRTACRKGFRKFIENAGAGVGASKIVACGSRGNAYRDFRTAIRDSTDALLLVDAEGPVTAQGAWQHLRANDNWERPTTATDGQCHLMVQSMESWFLAHVDALVSYYGQDFSAGALPANPNIELVPKEDVLAGLNRAARNTKKGGYKKGPDSYEILERLDPARVRSGSLFAERFIQALSSQG